MTERHALAVGITLLAAVSASAQTPPPDTAPQDPPKWVDLRVPGVLKSLEETDPERYARVRKVLDAGMELCAARNLEVVKARLGVRDAHCQELVLLTSNPPQHELRFTIDGTHYLARVRVTNAGPKLVPAK